jgi:predicted unusual protein kinase regulating ubiquinone biosynthesis (AarF/ABC1/UbiB family)
MASPHAAMRANASAARPRARVEARRVARASATTPRRVGASSGGVAGARDPAPAPQDAAFGPPSSRRGEAVAARAISPPVLSSLDELDMERGACAIAPKYSPALVRERTLSSPGEVAKTAARGVEIVTAVSLFAGSLVFDKFRSSEDVQGRSKDLRDKLARLGPSFVKAGQVLANRPDIVRADYMEQLCKLQDDVPAFPSEHAFAIMQRELGRPLDEVFEQISSTPVAAASLGQVYRATLKSTGEQVAVKVQRPGIEPVILRDLVLFRELARFVNAVAIERLGCNAQLIVDEFGEKLLEELDYVQEGRNLSDFYQNFENDPVVKIPKFYKELSGAKMLTMEWIDGVRCTDPRGIRESGIDVDEFIRVGVMSGLRQLLEFGLFHGDPHPGNIFAMRDGRIAYVDFGNVAQLSQTNKQTLVDAVVHAVNEDYDSMAGDFIRLGFLAKGTDVAPIVPALEKIWQDARTASLQNFNFRTVTGAFNELVYQYPIRIPERFSLVIRSLLTQEGICMSLSPDFRFLEVAYPYVAKRLLTDRDASLRDRLTQVLFDKDGTFSWRRLENLVALARESGGGLDLTDTVADGAQLLITDEALRRQLLLALTEDNRLRVDEVARVAALLGEDIAVDRLAQQSLTGGPAFLRKMALSWSDKVLSN